MDRQELAAFLRSRRERLRPADVGLIAGSGRRTPGLRREEVAELAYISTEYYTQLEQSRGPRSSRRVLAALARALRLSDAERDYLYALAGESPGPPPGPPREVRQSIVDLINRMPGSAVLVLDATYNVIAWNPLAAALLEDFSTLPPCDRNLIRRHFLGPHNGRPHYGMTDDHAFGVFAAGHLRTVLARYPDDTSTRALVAELVDGSARFTRLWESHDVREEQHLRKTMRHPVVGELILNCDVLAIPDVDQHVVVYTAESGSPSEEALRKLSVSGPQRMDFSRP
ncbi:helix-turn-helix domain-containing protein [Streptomyces sp. NPDC058405]|uniref:MmyB family transcriptional regulator n=1 Tax=Streptomyces sp. NPDC058405 TaxID=3346482 RepID=UPI0036503F0E